MRTTPSVRRVFVLALGWFLVGACDRGQDRTHSTTVERPDSEPSYPETATRAFDSMDGGIAVNDEERKGRNTWLLWTADNRVFWDRLARYGYGATDLLKTLDSRRRGRRFKQMGLNTDPDTRGATKPDQYGLWLDERVKPEPHDIDPRVYGHSSGVVGLRIFPNPEFDDLARVHWDPVRFYTDPTYYSDQSLVRPYLVGMACAFCHVGPNPLRPPTDPENPRWENLASNIGNQYFSVGKIFGDRMGEDNFVYQLLMSSPRGASDTSFIATDHINNPNAMNPIFNVNARLSVATEEKMAGGALNIPGVTETMRVPHILINGADSVGLGGALSRVFVNIGEYSDYWLQCHNALVGGSPQKPFEVAVARKNSPYWRASEKRVDNLASFFRRLGPMRLEAAPGGRAYLTTNPAVLTQGKIVFADHCAGCHSSKRPPASLTPNSPEYRQWFRASVQSPDFLDDNYLSTDQRYPVTLIKTNSARALQTNAVRGHVWDNFSSETYKTLPSVGEIEAEDLFGGPPIRFRAPAGGPGYYRPPTLVGVWATAPFLHNNMLGEFTGDPSVVGRIAAFNDAVQKLLWPEKRLGGKSIWRTTAVSYLELPAPYLPGLLSPLFQSGYLRLGPIPKGTPINLLANIDLDFSDPVRALRLLEVARHVKSKLLEIKVRNLNDVQTANLLKHLVPELLSVSKCPDFVEDRGHYFGAELSDSDKQALIEFLKTL